MRERRTALSLDLGAPRVGRGWRNFRDLLACRFNFPMIVVIIISIIIIIIVISSIIILIIIVISSIISIISISIFKAPLSWQSRQGVGGMRFVEGELSWNVSFLAVPILFVCRADHLLQVVVCLF